MPSVFLELFRYRWCVPVLDELRVLDGARFVELSRRLQVAEPVLRQTLDYLIEQGWVMRNPGYGHPLRPEYILTPTGSGLRLGKMRKALTAFEGMDLFAKWPVPALHLLDARACRQSELLRSLDGITPRALSQVLKEMQKAKLVERIVSDGSPPSVSYWLTAEGKAVAGAVALNQI